MKYMPSFHRYLFTTISVHTKTSLHHVVGFAIASHAGKMKASRHYDQEAGK
ncbi:MAG: hypothetical protein U0Z26_04345 [Anaerolineales bacterium]